MINHPLWRSVGYFLLSVVGIAFFAWMVIAIRDAREAAKDAQCRGHFCYILLGLHNYHDTYGVFPPAYVADANGKPMHSWRTLILPFLDGQSLYNQYRFEEPWDSENNLKVAAQLKTDLFRCPSRPSNTDPRTTNYVVIVGRGTAFPGSGVTKLEDFIDGKDDTIMFAELANSDILWTEPRDLVADEMSFIINDRTRPSISSAHPRGPGVLMAGGCGTYRLNKSHRAETIRALTTIAGQEPVSAGALRHDAKSAK